MRPLPQRFDDHRRHVRLGQQHDIRRQKPLDNQNAVLRNGFEARVLLAAKPPDDIAAQIQHVIGALAEGLVFNRLELLIPALQYPANDRFGGQQRGPQFTFEFARRKQPAEHLAMRPKDPGERGIEFHFDALCVLIELRQRFVDAVRETNQLAVNIVWIDRRRRAAPLQHIRDDPGPPHAQAR